MSAPRTDFLLADNARARWVRRSDGGKDFLTVQEMHVQPAVRPHPQGGSVEEGGGRASVEERRERLLKHRYRFADALAQAINAKAAKGDLERLYLVAPMRTLAAIRQRLTSEAEAKLVRVLAKDLTKTPDHKLGEWLHDLEPS